MRNLPEFDRVDEEFENDWATSMCIFCMVRPCWGDPRSHIMMGQYTVSGHATSRVPRWQERHHWSLQLRRRLVTELGDESDTTEILRSLQGYRSAGGVAHRAGKGAAKAIATLGISGMNNFEAFEPIAVRLADRLGEIANLCDAAATVASDDAGDE